MPSDSADDDGDVNAADVPDPEPRTFARRAPEPKLQIAWQLRKDAPRLRKAWVSSLALCAGLVVAACHAGSEEIRCEQWLGDANTAIEKVEVERRYEKTLELLAIGCDFVPRGLREAARQGFGKPTDQQRALLLSASTSYFSLSCAPADPATAASELPEICLGSDSAKGEYAAMLERIDAATYLYGKALQQELEKAGLYEPHGKEVLMNFFRANAFAREAELDRS